MVMSNAAVCDLTCSGWKQHVGFTCSKCGGNDWICEFSSNKGIKLPVLKKLYCLLIQLSLETEKYSNLEADLDIMCCRCGAMMKFKEIYSLSDALYKELDGRFKHLFYALQDVSSIRTRGRAASDSKFSASIEELTLLLRSCMVILTLLVFDQNLLFDKVQVLLSILSRLISIELTTGKEKISISFKKLVPSRCTHVDDNCTTSLTEEGVASRCVAGLSDTMHTFLCALLEVFADELLMHKILREYLMLIDSSSSTNEMVFMHFDHSGIGTVLEVIAAHFILSVSTEKASERFLNRLFWQHGNDFRIPDMSLSSSLSLLLNPIMLSAPKMFQAYLILLVSEAIDIGMPSEYLNPGVRIMDCYLTAFERSIILYNSHMASLNMVDHPGGSKGSAVKSSMLGSSQLAFELYLLPATRKKMNHLVTKFNDSWDTYINDISCKTKSDLVDASIAYVKDCLNVVDESCRDKKFSILTSIIHRASSENVYDTVLFKEGRSPQDMYLLASIMKLMSSSMLQATRCLRRSSNSGCSKNMQDVLLCKEYDFIVHLVGCFEQFNVDLPIQKFMSDMMKTHPTRHKESNWMFLHFSGLLSLSYVSGIDFLVKDCIFTLMSLLDLFVIEESDLDSLSLVFASRVDLFSSRFSNKIGEALVEQRSSITVALKFQKFQTSYLRKSSVSSFHKRNKHKQKEASEDASVMDHMESAISIESETMEACNGEIFLKCILEDYKRSSDFDDLADFIECKQGKDYSVWLKNRERFRKRKCQREVVYWQQKWKNKKYRS